jgi:hypothetical protein
MAQVASETPAMPHDHAARIVTVPDRFLARLWAVLGAVFLHPFETTIIRVVQDSDGG